MCRKSGFKVEKRTRFLAEDVGHVIAYFKFPAELAYVRSLCHSTLIEDNASRTYILI